MSEKDLGKALLHGQEPLDLQILTDRVLRRDRRRIWLLGTACVIAWMLVVMLPWALVLPMMAKVAQYQMDLNASAAPTAAQQQQIALGQVVHDGTVATFLSSIASMFVAAVCTVLLIILSRRAALRQLNARLAELSAQLRTLPGRPS